MKALSKVPTAAWLVGVGVLIVGFGVIAVDWREEVPAGEYIVGAGTLALALATFLLARYTAQQGELTRETIEAAERPFVIATPHAEHPEGLCFGFVNGDLQFHYRLWNIGQGPALVFRVSLQENEGKRSLIDFLTPRALAVNGVADLDADVPTFTVPLQDKFSLRIIYQDGSRRTYETRQELWREGETMIVSSLWFERRQLKGKELHQALDEMKG